MKKNAVIIGIFFGAVLSGSVAHAHASIASGPAFANTSQEVAFGIGHGCNGADTYRVRVEVPASVTSIRPMTSDFGRAAVEKNTDGKIVAISWKKPDANALDADDNYYKLVVRMKVPNAPFTQIYWKVYQTCRAADSTLTTTNWTTMPGETEGEPAAALTILPTRLTGWNQYTVPMDITDLSVFFKDAQIVWRGAAAYSFNANTTQLINGTPDVTALTELHANDVIWVRY